MSDIEKEFYKAFNIPQKFYTTVNFGDLDNNYQEVSADSLEELFNNYNSYFDEYIEKIENFMDWRSGHEPITSDIVLGLIKILTDKYGTIEIKPLHKKYYVASGVELYSNECETISGAILYNCIKHKDEISEEVKALFKC